MDCCEIWGAVGGYGLFYSWDLAFATGEFGLKGVDSHIAKGKDLFLVFVEEVHLNKNFVHVVVQEFFLEFLDMFWVGIDVGRAFVSYYGCKEDREN